MTFVVENESELGQKVFAEVAPRLKGGFKCGLTGELGAGKTMLVKKIASRLGVKETVTSPTFNIRKSYNLPENIYRAKTLQHIDLYRFNEPTPFDEMELADWLEDCDAITFVEWPEKVAKLSELLDFQLTLSVLGNNRRKVSFRWK